jgi:hypothetical protein
MFCFTQLLLLLAQLALLLAQLVLLSEKMSLFSTQVRHIVLGDVELLQLHGNLSNLKNDSVDFESHRINVLVNLGKIIGKGG